ncbi:endonuclease VIII [uncultured Culturomica sp.]|jgi:formamidopyrimidine-DNA glycosylase|uniref:endonuclease VIII n=1 Tax=uncultured Culturomica sp. TaxID=1926654 RepID=UPI000335D5AA|nr:endonuclease VIII [uncultured Culturomica sp.]CCZ10578.1 putative uncharacterized protein [Odoribacter sp. CAG:788]
MIEIPESAIISRQAAGVLTGRRIAEVIPATSPHKFTWYNGDPAGYPEVLEGRSIETVDGHGAFIDLVMDKDTHLLISDGTIMRYGQAGELHPVKHQQLLVLDDGSFLVFTVAMYGGIYAFQREYDNPYYQGSIHKLNPLAEAFDEVYFENMVRGLKKDVSAKALLATEQRIPGLGNGVVQDILYNAGIHPRRKVSTLGDLEKSDLLYSMKGTLANMVELGGRDTEKDFFGNWGGYKVILSKNTYKEPCPNCGHEIIREAYLGGTVYYCPVCQPLELK